MEMPNVVSGIQDNATGVIYEVVAYRTLTPEEVRRAVLFATTEKQRKKLKRGQTLRLVSLEGGL